MDAYSLTERIEASRGLDRPAEAIERRVPAVLKEAPWRQHLAGTWLGHALHPLLTDVPIGFWTSATVMDLLAPRRWRTASAALTGFGTLAALPTAVTGLVEWLDTDRAQRRVGVVHAVCNVSATTLYLASFVAKISRRRRLGVAAGVAGGAVASVGGYLGAHMSYARGAGVDHTTHHRTRHDPIEVTEVDGDRIVEAAIGERYLLASQDGATIAVPDRCTRCGGALGRSNDELLRCPRDGSWFQPARGTVERGPATTPLPRFVLNREGDHRMLVPMTGTPREG